MKPKRSLMVKTTAGQYMHLSDVAELSSGPFDDEEGTAIALAGTAPAFPLFLKVGEGSFVLDLSDAFNQRSCGIDTNNYYRSGDMTNEDKTERGLVEAWASIKYPTFSSFEQWKEAQ